MYCGFPQRKEALFVGQDGVSHQGVDLAGPAFAGENPVMADAGLHVMRLHVGSQAAAQVLRRERLADGADVVALALDGEQRGAADGARRDQPLAPVQRAARERELLEHADRVILAEDGDGARQTDARGAGCDRGEDDGGGGYHEVCAVVFSDTEDVEAQLVGQFRFLEEVPHAGSGWRHRAARLVPSRFHEGVESQPSAKAREQDTDIVLYSIAAPYSWDAPVMRWAYDWAKAKGIGTPFALSAP